jgi:hypothetical protein
LENLVWKVAKGVLTVQPENLIIQKVNQFALHVVQEHVLLPDHQFALYVHKVKQILRTELHVYHVQRDNLVHCPELAQDVPPEHFRVQQARQHVLHAVLIHFRAKVRQFAVQQQDIQTLEKLVVLFAIQLLPALIGLLIQKEQLVYFAIQK